MLGHYCMNWEDNNSVEACIFFHRDLRLLQETHSLQMCQKKLPPDDGVAGH